MNDIFIKSINILKSRNINNFEISLSGSERKHLILTGKNGSGKTSLLNELNNFLTQVESGNYKHYENIKNQKLGLIHQKSQEERQGLKSELQQTEKSIANLDSWLSQFGGIEILFANTNDLDLVNKIESGDFLIAFFDAKRQTTVKVPSGINKVNLKRRYKLKERVNSNFIQYIVNLKATRSFARDEGDLSEVEKIDNWFLNFEKRLAVILDVTELELRFDRKNYNFEIILPNKLPFGFNTLADGHSAIISIATELILRMEGHQDSGYDLEGIVLIDEIETHLHVDLQKKILPFLTSLFPRIQFIVTTHSPFVLSSISDAIICDLEGLFVTNDLSSYSYDALIESYFSSDKYSLEIKSKIVEYERLSECKELGPEEKGELRQLRNYFAHAPKYLSKELLVKLQQIELKALEK